MWGPGATRMAWCDAETGVWEPGGLVSEPGSPLTAVWHRGSDCLHREVSSSANGAKIALSKMTERTEEIVHEG